MRWLRDFLYLMVAIVTCPVWVIRMIRTGKIRTDWPGRLGRTPAMAAKTKRRILLHAVSVGEVNAIRALVDELTTGGAMVETAGGAVEAGEERAVEVVISTTTDTGFARAKSLWGNQHVVVRYPLDFSLCVERFLNSVKPDVVGLVELEIWPNFSDSCLRRSIPMVVINGRLTARSFRRYRQVSRLVRPMFHNLFCAAVQNSDYADRFESLGTPRRLIEVTGTMKWDTAKIEDAVAGAEELARDMGIDRTKPLIVAGSTAPDEHRLLLEATPTHVQLLCAPRKPEWFDQAATDLPNCVRRSNVLRHGARSQASSQRLFLLDTIGELRQAYALADLVVVGRSFGDLHGSDMMEPVALGKPTVVGPAVADFQDTVDALLKGDGLVQTTAEGLPETIGNLLNNKERQTQLGINGRAVILAHQGATKRTAAILRDALNCTRSTS